MENKNKFCQKLDFEQIKNRKDNKRNENIIGKITNRALIINSSNFNLFKVERIKHIKYKINTKGRG